MQQSLLPVEVRPKRSLLVVAVTFTLLGAACFAYAGGVGAAFAVLPRPVSTSPIGAKTGGLHIPRSADVAMAGFGASAKGKPDKGAKKSEIAPKRQWDQYKQLVKSGAKSVAVFAKLDNAWAEVGAVAVNSGTPAQAAQLQKRLILEHAVRVEPTFASRSRELQLGIANAGGEPELVEKQDIPDGLKCGFEGLSDPSGKYSKGYGVDVLRKGPTAPNAAKR